MAKANEQCLRPVLSREFDGSDNSSRLHLALDVKRDLAEIRRGALHIDPLAVSKPFALCCLGNEQRPIVQFAQAHVAKQLEPRAVCALRTEILPVHPAMLYWFKRGMPERAGHVAVKRADGGLGLIAQKISSALLVVNRFVGHAPALQIQIILMII